MKIKKIGHCCLVVDIRGNKIMTDPGAYSEGQETERDLCAVIISHEHADHFHVESLRKVMAANPQAIVVTNGSVGKILDAEGIQYKKVEDSETEKVNGVVIEGYGDVHAHIHDSIPPLQNTGYFLDNTFYYPGDALYNPGKRVNVLALPVSGPWLTISEAIKFAELVKPDICFPVHDGMLKNNAFGPVHNLPQRVLGEQGIEFVPMLAGDEREF